MRVSDTIESTKDSLFPSYSHVLKSVFFRQYINWNQGWTQEIQLGDVKEILGEGANV